MTISNGESEKKSVKSNPNNRCQSVLAPREDSSANFVLPKSQIFTFSMIKHKFLRVEQGPQNVFDRRSSVRVGERLALHEFPFFLCGKAR